jgi:hypothetical protein
MITELFIASESPEVSTARSGTLGVGEFGEVAIPTAKANSVLVTMIWIGEDMIPQLIPRGKDPGAITTLGRSWSRRSRYWNDLTFNDDDSRHMWL